LSEHPSGGHGDAMTEHFLDRAKAIALIAADE
jgi:hypothetical protein